MFGASPFTAGGSCWRRGWLTLPLVLLAPAGSTWDLFFANSHDVEAIQHILPGFLFISLIQSHHLTPLPSPGVTLCSYLQHVRNSLQSLHSESQGRWTSQRALTDIKGEPEETGKGNTFAALALSPSPDDSPLLTG